MNICFYSENHPIQIELKQDTRMRQLIWFKHQSIAFVNWFKKITKNGPHGQLYLATLVALHLSVTRWLSQSFDTSVALRLASLLRLQNRSLRVHQLTGRNNVPRWNDLVPLNLNARPACSCCNRQWKISVGQKNDTHWAMLHVTIASRCALLTTMLKFTFSLDFCGCWRPLDTNNCGDILRYATWLFLNFPKSQEEKVCVALKVSE